MTFNKKDIRHNKKDIKMNAIIKFVSAVILSAFTTAAVAQTSQDEMIKTRAREKVSQMCDYIEFMANPQNSLDVRKKYKERAVRLFMGNCEPYEDDGVTNKGVVMEITSIYRTTPRRRLMKDYFTGLMNMRYSKVEVKSSDIHDMQVSNLKKISDDMYVCTVAYVQTFLGYRDGRPVYGDRTKKTVKVYIFVEETMDGIEYVVRLGDTKASETTKIK